MIFCFKFGSKTKQAISLKTLLVELEHSNHDVQLSIFSVSKDIRDLMQSFYVERVTSFLAGAFVHKASLFFGFREFVQWYSKVPMTSFFSH